MEGSSPHRLATRGGKDTEQLPIAWCDSSMRNCLFLLNEQSKIGLSVDKYHINIQSNFDL